MKPNKNLIKLPLSTLIMGLKSMKLLLLISIPAIIGVSLIIFFSIFTHSSPWGHAGGLHLTPNYILWLFGILLIFAVVPLSHHFASQKLEKRMEENIRVISKLVNKNNHPLKKEQKENDKNIILKFLNPNERVILKKLIENKGTVLQSEISRMEGMTKLKTHRTVKDLERKGVIKTETYGKTNRIILTEDIKDIFQVLFK